MDSSVSDGAGKHALRRSTRQTSGKLTTYEATPRGPLKRTRSSRISSLPVVAYSKELEDDIEDDESLSEKRRREAEGDMARVGHENDRNVQRSEPMEVEEDLGRDAVQDSSRRQAMSYERTPRGPVTRSKKSLTKRPTVLRDSNDLERDDKSLKKRRLEAEEHMARDGHENDGSELMEVNEDLQMDAVQDSSRGHDGAAIPRPHEDRNFSSHVVASVRCRIPVNENVKESTLTEGHVASTKPPARLKAPRQRPDMSDIRITANQDYQRKIEAKTMRLEMPPANHHIRSVYPAPENYTTIRKPVNNNPLHKEHFQHQERETKKAAVIKDSLITSGRGWCHWPLIFTVLLICVTILLALKFLPRDQSLIKGGDHPCRAPELETFADQLSLLQTQFPSQRPELWRRSKIHLEKHLKTAQPTEPVSLIFTAGLGAEQTLRCLAQGLAASFSSALNGSLLYIDGADTAGMDSDQVKLDIDNQLRAAFEGDKPAAVIHRLEEFPPGSTLIFYRYCDHEHAAYKRVFLLFTVLLPQDVLGEKKSLREVEENVQDYLRERLVDSNNTVSYNGMDGDKYGGLWSRISHLILPVVLEKEVELRGC
ncbi:torsin-1A-interacting protein 2-like isoform X2 [Takifugu flavidus]|uniref:torsin-1A-interacting protein 2-like isoform X2 n=1 Tax=Takifugu flavidus TaxID=433684 RepID=UPI002544BB87|nr:torsin-1A-interacting protein 2-like isoform X2 [Takifugu flavidus]